MTATSKNMWQPPPPFMEPWLPFILQSMTITMDLDNNGWKEVIVAGPHYILMYEAWADDSYRLIWWAESVWNIFHLAYVGDSDGDGLKEFLVGSFDIQTPGYEHCTLYEYTGTGGFDITWEVSYPYNSFSDDGPSVDAADLDGDGLSELICGCKVDDVYVLNLIAGYKQSRLCLDFTLGVPWREPDQGDIRWFTALLVQIGPSWQWIPITSTILEPILPSKDFPLAFPFPRMGWIGIYSALISDSGVEASAFDVVNTGGGSTESSIEVGDILGALPSSGAILRTLGQW